MTFKGRDIDDILSEVAITEGGGVEAASEPMKGRSKVILVLPGKVSDADCFTFAMNSAQRVGANIEVLLFTDRKVDKKQLEDFETELKDKKVGYEIVRTHGCMKTRILERTSSSSDVQFVVAESMETLRSDCSDEQRSLRGMLKKLRCPLVLVSEHEKQYKRIEVNMKKNKPYLKALVFGIISIASYAILFMNVNLVMDEFTRGGAYAALPVGCVFYFSFMHGAFASNVLDVLGLEAKKKK